MNQFTKKLFTGLSQFIYYCVFDSVASHWCVLFSVAINVIACLFKICKKCAGKNILQYTYVYYIFKYIYFNKNLYGINYALFSNLMLLP